MAVVSIILFASQIWTDRLICVLCSFYQQQTHPYRRKDFYVFSNTLLDKYLIIRHFDNSKTPFSIFAEKLGQSNFTEKFYLTRWMCCVKVLVAMKGVALVIITSIVTVQKPAYFMYSNFMYFQAYLYFPNNRYTDKLTFNSVWY